MPHIPNEVLLEFFPHFVLQSLIAGRGVCKLWKNLIKVADIPLERRRLLELYKRLIRSPAFLPTRPWTIEHLQPFDRQAYVDALLDQHNAIPKDFRLWILEWPSRAAINCLWPGLPSELYSGGAFDQNRGANFLATFPPIVYAIQFNVADQIEWHLPPSELPYEWDWSDGEYESRALAPHDSRRRAEDDFPADNWVDAPALLVHRVVEADTWLVLEPQSPETPAFSVFHLGGDQYDGIEGNDGVEPTWTTFLHTQLNDMEWKLRCHQLNDPTQFGVMTLHPSNFRLWTDTHQTGRKSSQIS